MGVHIKGYYSKEYGKFHREVDEVVEFYVDNDNKPQSHILYQKTFGKAPVQNVPSDHLREYLENQNIFIDNLFTKGDSMRSIDNEVSKIVDTLPDEQPRVVESPIFNNNINQGEQKVPKASFFTDTDIV